jgi:hypothetical protein
MTLEGLNEDFQDLPVLFADAGVEFVIVGAYALAFHGAPRASGDIDLFVRPTPANAQRTLPHQPTTRSSPHHDEGPRALSARRRRTARGRACRWNPLSHNRNEFGVRL